MVNTERIETLSWRCPWVNSRVDLRLGEVTDHATESPVFCLNTLHANDCRYIFNLYRKFRSHFNRGVVIKRVPQKRRRTRQASTHFVHITIEDIVVHIERFAPGHLRGGSNVIQRSQLTAHGGRHSRAGTVPLLTHSLPLAVLLHLPFL